MIKELNLKNYADNSRGFTYADSNYRIVFIDENLSEDEKTIVLAHEAGHIFCKHFGKKSIIGSDVTDEYEANEFVHYLLNMNTFSRIKAKAWANKLKIAMCATAVTVFVILSISIVKLWQAEKYYGEYYITETGTKYHLSDCRIVKHKTDIERLTKEDFESGDYEPCGICLPDEKSSLY